MNRYAYQNAQPFPHGVYDNLWDEILLRAVRDEFPDQASPRWRNFQDRREVKQDLSPAAEAGPHATQLQSLAADPAFLKRLETLTEIDDLLADPSGGALHQINPGGVLEVHVDHNRDKVEGTLYRRLNILIYLNEDWREEWNGQLELWNPEMTECVEQIMPLFNRTVIFSTTETSAHGHPQPLKCPGDRCRQSFAAYYYTQEAPPNVGQMSGTRFRV